MNSCSGWGGAAWDRFADVRFLRYIKRRHWEGSQQKRDETRRKQETGNKAGEGGPALAGWTTASLADQDAMSRMPPLLPYPPCSPLAHARYVLRWCGSYADITLSRGGKGWVACGEGGGVQERERRVYRRNHAICQPRWMQQGTTCAAALLPSPTSAAGSPQAASKRVPGRCISRYMERDQPVRPSERSYGYRATGF